MNNKLAGPWTIVTSWVVHLLGLLILCSMHSPADSTTNAAVMARMAITGLRHEVSLAIGISGGRGRDGGATWTSVQ